ncbi:FAD-binding domain-containing protein [Aulographum hederae CBS 113979]|uniref:Delta(24)-sterol reductase n=1 Tax=Aulographum hederae CBS 113979 TaxID=1176131 RepID=A0A6G1HGC1_9PEZI|nr:FAD-binding domain-containing protein [Aulographum hederae CBS 113979]
MEAHEAAVKKISAKVKEFHDRKEGFRIYHGSTNTTRRSERTRETMVDLSSLNNVLRVNSQNKTASVEPNVPMDELVKATLKHNLLPCVVMEFPGITCGGAFAGTGGESSSFKYGTFDRTVTQVEMVLANGDVVRASELENSDLFVGSAGAFGTLGVLTLLEVNLIDAKRYVELTYHPLAALPDVVAETRKQCKPEANNDFVDGILFRPATFKKKQPSATVITGKLVDKPSDSKKTSRINRFTRPLDPWYYVHVQAGLKRGKGSWTELVPVQDYFFRYDRGAFWCGRNGFKYFLMPFNRLTRLFFDPVMHTRELFVALHASQNIHRSIIQDLTIPAKHLKEFIEYMIPEFDISPLWICPMPPNTLQSTEETNGTPNEKDSNTASAPESTSGANPPECEGISHPDDLYINVGLWGMAPFDINESIALNRQLEAKVKELGGAKWLYGQTFYTEEEFWSIYDKVKYDALRTKYGATSLPSAYDKVKTNIDVEKTISFKYGWPFGGVIGYGAALKARYMGREYLLSKGKK